MIPPKAALARSQRPQPPLGFGPSDARTRLTGDGGRSGSRFADRRRPTRRAPGPGVDAAAAAAREDLKHSHRASGVASLVRRALEWRGGRSAGPRRSRALTRHEGPRLKELRALTRREGPRCLDPPPFSFSWDCGRPLLQTGSLPGSQQVHTKLVYSCTNGSNGRRPDAAAASRALATRARALTASDYGSKALAGESASSCRRTRGGCALAKLNRCARVHPFERAVVIPVNPWSGAWPPHSPKS